MRSGGGDDDRSTRARIRDAAIARFAADGFVRATVRAVAADAEVSPGLVLHHFGSKDGLRRACDDHVVSVITGWVEPWLAQPGSLSELFASGGDLIGYVRRAVVEGDGRTDALIDRFVELTEQLLAEAQARGTVRPTDDPRARAAVVVVWDLATVVLGAHLRRVLGESGDEAVLGRYGRVAEDIYTHGLFQERRP